MINQTDIEVDDNGDLVVASNGDLSIATPYRVAMQDIIYRVRTQFYDSKFHEFLGADLAKYVGQPNTQETANQIISSVTAALTRDNRFRASNLHVDVVPVANTEVVLLVGVTDRIEGVSTETVLVATFGLNYSDGTITIMR